MTSRSDRQRWSSRSLSERFELMTVWSSYFMCVFVPFSALMAVAPLVTQRSSVMHSGAVLLYLVVVVVVAGLTGSTFVAAMRAKADRGPRPMRRIQALLALTALLVLLVIAGVESDNLQAISALLLIPGVSALAACTPLLRPRTMTVGGLAVLVTMVLGSGLVLGFEAPLVTPVPTALFLLTGIELAAASTAWMMSVVWQLDEARTVAARLAVAEERLRFSRDLHDVFGRTLSTVAVKSELAAAFAQRGDPRGAEEMLAVRQLAHEALREVRGVVQGYRSADLDTEIAGARALLRSAGVPCRVSGFGLQLPAAAAEGAAWVVREAVTNVVRHADASYCEIVLSATESGCTVDVRNDGVRPGASAGGSGLRGLAERLGSRGGSLTSRFDGDCFVVEAVVTDDGGQV